MDNLIAYLTVHDCAAALDFYATAFGAEEISRWTDDDGRIGHAEIRIGGTGLYLSDEYPEVHAISPRTAGHATASMVITVDDCDQVYAAAMAAGGIEDRPVVDQAYGHRSGWLVDPFGVRWNIASVIPVEPGSEFDDGAPEG